MRNLTKALISSLLIGGALASAGAQNLVTNGGFETITSRTSSTPLPGGISYIANRTGYNDNGAVMTGWTNLSVVGLIEAPGMADVKVGSPRLANGNVGTAWYILGPKNGYNNGLTDTSPVGGNYFAVDSNWNTNKLSQAVTGLVPGQQYELSFWWAAGVLSTWNDTGVGANAKFTSGWDVTITGSDNVKVLNEKVLSRQYGVPEFIDWTKASFTFTASTASEVLQFWAQGTGSPPMSLLDGVSITAVPEPGTWALLGAGLLGIGLIRRRRLQRQD